jgi:hypothetical protein
MKTNASYDERMSKLLLSKLPDYAKWDEDRQERYEELQEQFNCVYEHSMDKISFKKDDLVELLRLTAVKKRREGYMYASGVLASNFNKSEEET